MATTIDWPEDLPHLNNVRMILPDTRYAFQPDAGPPITRQNNQASFLGWSGTLTMTKQQLVEFLYFWRTTLDHGSLSFNSESPLDDVMVETKFVALDGPAEMVRNGDPEERLWVASVTLMEVATSA